jgi:excisionase family DNA binding protein
MTYIKGKQYVTIREASEMTGVPVVTFRSYVAHGLFKDVQRPHGTRYLVRKTEVKAFMQGKISVKGIYAGVEARRKLRKEQKEKAASKQKVSRKKVPAKKAPAKKAPAKKAPAKKAPAKKAPAKKAPAKKGKR